MLRALRTPAEITGEAGGCRFFIKQEIPFTSPRGIMYKSMLITISVHTACLDLTAQQCTIRDIAAYYDIAMEGQKVLA